MGYFYATVHIGTPAQSFGVILDTGSSIMSVPCENCSRTACGTHLDKPFQVSASVTANDTGLKFQQSYSEGSSLYGTYVEDLICIGDCVQPEAEAAAPDGTPDAAVVDPAAIAALDAERLRYRFGCARKMTNLFSSQLADGIMGMANDSGAFVHTLMALHRVDHSLFTLCLAYEGGSFGLGDYSREKHWSEVVWIPLQQAAKKKKLYYVCAYCC
jgi:hypothetical protein